MSLKPGTTWGKVKSEGEPLLRGKDKILSASPLTLAVVYEWGSGEFDALGECTQPRLLFFQVYGPWQGGPRWDAR